MMRPVARAPDPAVAWRHGRPGGIRGPTPVVKRWSDQDDDELVEALANGDEATFSGLVEAWSPAMLRMARVHVPTPALAEDVVQEAWLVVLQRLREFKRRSSLRTWVLGVVVNVARARARSERRSAAFSAHLRSSDADGCLGAERFLDADHERWPRHWALGPTPWPTPEERLLDGETCDVILRAVAALPAAQREVLTLRDIEGWPADETCATLGLTPGNQRVLLHRARCRVRLAVEEHFGAVQPTT